MSPTLWPRFLIFVGIVLSIFGLFFSYSNRSYIILALMGGGIFGLGLGLLDSARNSAAYQKYLKEKEERKNKKD